MISTIIFILCTLFGSQQLSATTPAVRVLDSFKYPYASTSIIDKNEWKELQLDRLVTALDRTKTSFGRWGLVHLLDPVSDRNELIKRQQIVSFLVEHEDVLLHFQKQLSELKKYESSLLSYWDTKDQINKNCDQFYYVIPGLKNYLNNSSVALNVSVAAQTLDSCRSLVMSLCLGGVYDEFLTWSMTEQKDFSFSRGLQRGLELPLRQHSFALDLLKDDKENTKYSLKDYIRVELKGSLGDRYHMLKQGLNFDATSFGFSEKYSRKAEAPAGFFAKGSAFLGATTQTVIYDYMWGTSLLSVARNIVFMHSSLKQLTERVIDVASCSDAMGTIMGEMQEYAHVFGTYVNLDNRHTKAMSIMQEIVKKQRSHKYVYQYSRGHVLAMHREIKQIKSALIPVLQAIAMIDAYCSIAQLYKEHENKENRFSFVQFTESSEPFIAYDSAWLALLSSEKAVANNVHLGKEYAGKIVITGPNGGGKSTLLKTVGVAAILAQSWGIVPASSAEQTIFSTIKTGLSPHEDLQQGLSTFMAEKKCMEHLDGCIKRTHKAHSMLVLIDEPYKGTVDDESAKRIYNFGMSIAANPYALVCIATHVKKPILLATDTQGVFANYHVEIKEKSHGEFERLFTVEQGPATWWFEDEGQRGRFVDWISSQLGVQNL